MRIFSIITLAALLVGCGGGVNTDDDSIIDSSGKADGISKPLAGTYEITSAQNQAPRLDWLVLKSDGTYIRLYATKPYDLSKDSDQQPGASIQAGKFTYTKSASGKTVIRFFDASGNLIDKFNYSVKDFMLTLSATGVKAFDMDPLSDFMCQTDSDCAAQGVPVCAVPSSCDRDSQTCGCGDLTTKWVEEVKVLYIENCYDLASNDIFTGLDRSDLPKNAQLRLDIIDRDWGPDYAAAAYKMTVDNSIVYVIQEENDGGMFVFLFNASGWLIASGGAGESSDFSWH